MSFQVQSNQARNHLLTVMVPSPIQTLCQRSTLKAPAEPPNRLRDTSSQSRRSTSSRLHHSNPITALSSRCPLMRLALYRMSCRSADSLGY